MQKENRLKNLSFLSRDRKACCPQKVKSEGDGVQVAASSHPTLNRNDCLIE